jgi:hypothetical protein
MDQLYIRPRVFKITLIDKKKLKIFNNLLKAGKRILILMYGTLKKVTFLMLSELTISLIFYCTLFT